MPKISVGLSIADIDSAISKISDYKKEIDRNVNEVCRRLAQFGVTVAEASYSGAAYLGNKDVSVTMEQTQHGYAVKADGKTALILEFGAGVTYGYGHPQADQFGFGPGTYPNQKHAMDPKGWYLPKSAGGEHTYGNAPSMSMYNAAKDIEREVQRVVREVFQP